MSSEKFVIFFSMFIILYLSELNLICHFTVQSFILIRSCHVYSMQTFIFTTLDNLVLLNFTSSLLTLFCKGDISTPNVKSCSYKASSKRLHISLNNIRS